jgi:hypothetical protein
LADSGSIMGIVATEQFSYLNDEEVILLYQYLSKDWTQDLALEEESKIPGLYRFNEDGID